MIYYGAIVFRGNFHSHIPLLTFQILLFILLFIVAGALFGAVYTIYKLLQWRSKYKEQLVSFPEPLYDDFHSLRDNMAIVETKVQTDFKIYADAVDQNNTLLDELSNKVTNQFSDILQSFKPLLKQLDLKDQEIDRLKRSYDMYVLKKCVNKLILILDGCLIVSADAQMTDETKKEIQFVAGSIYDLLIELGVKEYSFDKGISTKNKQQFGMPPWNEWVTTLTTSSEDAFSIVQTLEKGYYIDGEIKEVLKFPKIEVLITEEING